LNDFLSPPRIGCGALPHAIASPRGRLGHDRHVTSSPRARPVGHIVRLEGGHTRAPARFHAGSRSQVEESQWPRAAAYASSFARLDTRPSGALAPGTGVWFHNQGEKRDGLNPLPLVSAASSRQQELSTSVRASCGMCFPHLTSATKIILTPAPREHPLQVPVLPSAPREHRVFPQPLSVLSPPPVHCGRRSASTSAACGMDPASSDDIGKAFAIKPNKIASAGAQTRGSTP